MLRELCLFCCSPRNHKLLLARRNAPGVRECYGIPAWKERGCVPPSLSCLYGRGAGVGRGLGVGVGLAVGVGLGVRVGVGVGECVGVVVGVGVNVGVGEGVGFTTLTVPTMAQQPPCTVQ